MEKLVKVVDVKRDDRNKAVWVIMGYWEEKRLKCKVVFMPREKEPIFFQKEPKRFWMPQEQYGKMKSHARSIISEERKPKLHRPDIPLP